MALKNSDTVAGDEFKRYGAKAAMTSVKESDLTQIEVSKPVEPKPTPMDELQTTK